MPEQTKEERLTEILLDTQRLLNEALAMPTVMLRPSIAAIVFDNNNLLKGLGITPPDASERAKI